MQSGARMRWGCAPDLYHAWRGRARPLCPAATREPCKALDQRRRPRLPTGWLRIGRIGSYRGWSDGAWRTAPDRCSELQGLRSPTHRLGFEVSELSYGFDPASRCFSYSDFPRSELMSTGLQHGVELVPRKPNPALFTPTEGGGG
jgi:hypothetical protein